jgi:hypothetical protein
MGEQMPAIGENAFLRRVVFLTRILLVHASLPRSSAHGGTGARGAVAAAVRGWRVRASLVALREPARVRNQRGRSICRVGGGKRARRDGRDGSQCGPESASAVTPACPQGWFIVSYCHGARYNSHRGFPAVRGGNPSRQADPTRVAAGQGIPLDTRPVDRNGLAPRSWWPQNPTVTRIQFWTWLYATAIF